MMNKICICVPCFNESQRLPTLVEQIRISLSDKTEVQFTFYFLNDGSAPAETKKMQQIVEICKIPGVYTEFLNFPINRGKGAVLRDGFKQALQHQFDYIGFCDGDGATPIDELVKILRAFEVFPETDVIIGSRWKALGYTINRSLKRHLSGRVFATLLSNIFNIPVYDSQCGAKVFRRRVLSLELLEFCFDQKWLFDTQLLIVLFHTKAKILEFPVNWTDQAGSKISFVRDCWRMFWGLLKFKKYLDLHKSEPILNNRIKLFATPLNVNTSRRYQT
jgi:glycosyltransferase involved in cell wall biosynthesis